MAIYSYLSKPPLNMQTGGCGLALANKPSHLTTRPQTKNPSTKHWFPQKKKTVALFLFLSPCFCSVPFVFASHFQLQAMEASKLPQTPKAPWCGEAGAVVCLCFRWRGVALLDDFLGPCWALLKDLWGSTFDCFIGFLNSVFTGFLPLFRLFWW